MGRQLDVEGQGDHQRHFFLHYEKLKHIRTHDWDRGLLYSVGNEGTFVTALNTKYSFFFYKRTKVSLSNLSGQPPKYASLTTPLTTFPFVSPIPSFTTHFIFQFLSALHPDLPPSNIGHMPPGLTLQPPPIMHRSHGPSPKPSGPSPQPAGSFFKSSGLSHQPDGHSPQPAGPSHTSTSARRV